MRDRQLGLGVLGKAEFLGVGRRTARTIRPIAMAYYVDVTVIAAWCELRSDFRHFRTDRITSAQLLDERFTAESARLTAQWMVLSKEREEAPV